MLHLRRHPFALTIAIYSLLFFLIRIIALDQTFFLHDERDIIFSGLSLARTGADLYGTIFPLQFTGINPDNPLISIWFSAIGWFFTPFYSVFFARLPFVIFSSLLPVIMYLLSLTITRNRYFSLIFMFFATHNPWTYHLTRYAMDITIALPIILIAIIAHLKKRYLLAYVLYVFTLFNYQGFRIAIPFLLLGVELFLFSEKEAPIKSFIHAIARHAIFLLLLFIMVTVIDRQVSFARINQVVFFNQEKFAGVVDEKRRLTRAPLWLSSIFDNKFTENYRYVLEGFVNGFNVDIFFFEGDQSATNGTGVSGLLFITTFPLLICGMYVLRSSGKPYIFLTSFILLGMTPAVASLNGRTYGIRGSLMIIGFSALITLGLIKLANMFRHNTVLSVGLISCLTVCLAIDALTFGYQYFFRRPILLGEMYNQREVTLARSLESVSPKMAIVVYDNEPKNLFTSYLFLTKTPLALVQKLMRESRNNRHITENIEFRDCDIQWESKDSYAMRYISNRCLVTDDFHEMESRKLASLSYTDTPLTAFFIVEPLSKSKE